MVMDLFTKAIVEPAAFLQFRDYLLINLQNGPGTHVVLHRQVARLRKTLLELGTKGTPGW